MDGNQQNTQTSPSHKKRLFPELKNIPAFLREHWAIITVLLIVVLGVQVRTLDYRWPYLRNIDSYNFMRDMQVIVENGGVFPGFDPLMTAPEGAIKTAGSYAYLGAYSFMTYNVFFPAVPLWQFLIWWPALLASLLAVPTYFLTKKLYDKRAGVIAAFLIVFDVSIMARTLGGDPDNDNIVLLLPLIIITAFIYLQHYFEKKEKFDSRGLIYSLAVGVVLSVWAWTWGGYWFVVWIMVVFVLLKIAVNSFTARSITKAVRKFRPSIIGLAVMMAVMIAFMTLFIDRAFPVVLLSQLASITNFGAAIKSEIGIFPSVYVSVAELQSAGGLADIVRREGLPFFTALLSIIYLFYSYAKTKKHLDTAILLLIWFFGPMIAAVVAVRFTIFFSTPIAIGTGILFSKIIRMAAEDDRSLDS